LVAGFLFMSRSHDNAVTVSPKEARRILDITNQTLLAWRTAGLLHPTRLPNGWNCYDRAEVLKLARLRSKHGRLSLSRAVAKP
jgi:DNA-binding transcriptional MerR regulator